MPRTARIVVPGVAHHVRQRGNRRQQTFFSEVDYARYVDLAGEGCRDALAPAHRRDTWIVNRRNGRQGHLWQNRFFSCPLDEAHLVKFVCCVELNPMCARMGSSPEDWRWSSARARVAGMGDALMRAGGRCRCATSVTGPHFSPWSRRRRTQRGSGTTRAGKSHLGSEAFLAQIEAQIGRSVRPRPRGRPRRGSEGERRSQQQPGML